MHIRNRTKLVVALVGTVALLACSHESATSPDAPATASARLSTVPGSYDLTFVNSARQEISTLVVGTAELILKAHVSDGLLHNPAQQGTVTFEYCGYKGPAGDITRPDEAPSADCASGVATWKRLGSVGVNASGDAYFDFGVVQIPRTVGFRFKYSSQGSDVPSGTSVPRDFTWTAAPIL